VPFSVSVTRDPFNYRHEQECLGPSFARNCDNSLRRMGDSLLGIARSRFELFAVELQEEKLRTVNLIIYLVVVLALVVAGLLFGLGALAIYLWAVAGYFGLIGLALVLLAAGGGALLRIKHQIRNGPKPFAETIDEFRKDRACLGNDN
jgi:uncharacterized membrane protein YqjE